MNSKTLIALLIAGSAFGQGITGVIPQFPSTTFGSLSSSVPTGTIYSVTDIGVNGSLWRFNGTRWGLLGGHVTLVQSGMPFVLLGSGSVASNGAISGLTTALPFAYAKAWCYFPANIVATVAAAGWRYCTWSSTSAGTAFLDQPGSSFPVTWPASPTAVTDGKGAYTGQSSGTVVQTPSITLPASAMGVNGRLEYRGAESISAVSTLTAQGLMLTTPCGAGGQPPTNAGGTFVVSTITNRGNAALQHVANLVNGSGSSASGSASVQCTINTASSQPVTAFLQAIGASATINHVLESFAIDLYNDGQ